MCGAQKGVRVLTLGTLRCERRLCFLFVSLPTGRASGQKKKSPGLFLHPFLAAFFFSPVRPTAIIPHLLPVERTVFLGSIFRSIRTWFLWLLFFFFGLVRRSTIGHSMEFCARVFLCCTVLCLLPLFLMCVLFSSRPRSYIHTYYLIAFISVTL
jgi:hypothetical protein